jgi:hypothetical protein
LVQLSINKGVRVLESVKGDYACEKVLELSRVIELGMYSARGLACLFAVALPGAGDMEDEVGVEAIMVAAGALPPRHHPSG